MVKSFVIAYGKEVLGKIDEVTEKFIHIRFPTSETPSMGSEILVRDEHGNVEISGELLTDVLGTNLVQMKIENYFDECKISHLKFDWIFSNDYEDALQIYNDLLSLEDTYTVSITEVLDSSDYETEKFRQIPKDEDRKTEFKQTFSLDIKSGKKESYLSEGVIKTIASFMNSKGGTIFIGVTDDGQRVGVSDELTKFHGGNKDKFKRHVQDIALTSLGAEAVRQIQFRFLEEGEITILKIFAETASTPVFYNKDKFYIRLDASNKELRGEDLYKYFMENQSKS
jgi:hypothetical protein